MSSELKGLKKMIELTYDIDQKIEDGGEVSIITTNHIKYKPKNEFVILFARSLFLTIQEYNLNATDIKTILCIINYAQYGNLISYSRKSLCNDIGIDNSRLGKTLKKLKECGILLETKRGEFLNPQVITKGSLKDFADKVEFEELVQKGAKVLDEKLKTEANIETKKMREIKYGPKKEEKPRIDDDLLWGNLEEWSKDIKKDEE